MEVIYLNPLIESSKNAYELVRKLMDLRDSGYTHVKANNDRHKIGYLLYMIVGMSKHGCTYSEIVDELLQY